MFSLHELKGVPHQNPLFISDIMDGNWELKVNLKSANFQGMQSKCWCKKLIIHQKAEWSERAGDCRSPSTICNPEGTNFITLKEQEEKETTFLLKQT